MNQIEQTSRRFGESTESVDWICIIQSLNCIKMRKALSLTLWQKNWARMDILGSSKSFASHTGLLLNTLNEEEYESLNCVRYRHQLLDFKSRSDFFGLLLITLDTAYSVIASHEGKVLLK